PYSDGDVNQSVSNGTECASAVAHSRKYIIGGEAGCGAHCVGSPIFDELFARLTLEDSRTLGNGRDRPGDEHSACGNAPRCGREAGRLVRMRAAGLPWGPGCRVSLRAAHCGPEQQVLP